MHWHYTFQLCRLTSPELQAIQLYRILSKQSVSAYEHVLEWAHAFTVKTHIGRVVVLVIF